MAELSWVGQAQKGPKRQVFGPLGSPFSLPHLGPEPGCFPGQSLQERAHNAAMWFSALPLTCSVT